MTIKDEARELFYRCKSLIRDGITDTVPYVSGTKNKRTKMTELVKVFKEDTDLDYKLGVISKEEHEIEVKAVELYEKMLKNFIVY